jgi:hypothetical protein
VQSEETYLRAVPMRDYEFIAGLDFGECSRGSLYIGALSLRGHRLATT